jgi:hypothetical protein
MVRDLLCNWIARPSEPDERSIPPNPLRSRLQRRGPHAVRPSVEALEARQTPSLSFASQQTFAAGNGPEGVATADFNGDGKPDLATADISSKAVAVLLNTTPAGASTPSFAAPQTFAVGNGAQAVATADFNGDGKPDLAVLDTEDGRLSVLLNTTIPGSATVSFATQQTFYDGGAPISVAVADINGDGRPDLAAPNETASGTVSVLLDATSAGAGTVSFAAQQTFAVGSGPIGIAAADLNGDGRADIVTSNFDRNTVSVLLSTTAPFPSVVPVVAGQFGSAGVWEYNRALGTWIQLTAANASHLAANPAGDVVGAFSGAGVWEYKPSGGWRQINGVDATVLVMDSLGDVAAEFPGYGVGEFLPASGWRSLTPSNATLLAIDSLGDVAGEFPGYGVWLFRPSSGWAQINGVDAALLAMDSLGNVVADFPGFGIGEYHLTGGWQSLNGYDAKALAVDRYGDVAADFAGFGVGEYYPTRGWRSLTGADASLLAFDAFDDVLGEFPGHGVWEFDTSRGWFQLTAANATLLAVG